jgi:hypothetical protein
MRSLRLFTVLVIMLVLDVKITAQAPAGQAGGARGPAAPPFTMTMSFPDGAQLPLKNSALGAMLSPEVNWTNVPKGTVSFVLSMDDNDFSRNHTTEGMLHWFVWNIPGTATGLPEGVPMGQLSNGAYQISASGQMYRAPAGPEPRLARAASTITFFGFWLWTQSWTSNRATHSILGPP